MTKPAVMRFNDHSVLRKLFDKMLATLKTDIVYGNFTCSSLIYQYIIEFHRLASDRNTIGGSGISNVFVPALNYIEENFREDFSVSVLAEISGISQQYLCRIFKQAMNMRPNEYITRRRLQESKLLLIETDIPICKICLQSGFSDSGYFSTVFKHQDLSVSSAICFSVSEVLACSAENSYFSLSICLINFSLSLTSRWYSSLYS